MAFSFKFNKIHDHQQLTMKEPLLLAASQIPISLSMQIRFHVTMPRLSIFMENFALEI